MTDTSDTPAWVRNAKAAPFIPVSGQYFLNFDDWVNSAASRLTEHCEYLNTEHGGEGYRGAHFTALCFDQRGRHCRTGRDFMRARSDDTFPIWWVWPDQLLDLLVTHECGQIIPEKEGA